VALRRLLRRYENAKVSDGRSAVSLVARVVRSFHDGAEAVSLERVVALPHMPTMGTRLDLCMGV
jgi:hypothetical protein